VLIGCRACRGWWWRGPSAEAGGGTGHRAGGPRHQNVLLSGAFGLGTAIGFADARAMAGAVPARCRRGHLGRLLARRPANRVMGDRPAGNTSRQPASPHPLPVVVLLAPRPGDRDAAEPRVRRDRHRVRAGVRVSPSWRCRRVGSHGPGCPYAGHHLPCRTPCPVCRAVPRMSTSDATRAAGQHQAEAVDEHCLPRGVACAARALRTGDIRRELDVRRGHLNLPVLRVCWSVTHRRTVQTEQLTGAARRQTSQRNNRNRRA
jgi:hypothetical protein